MRIDKKLSIENVTNIFRCNLIKLNSDKETNTLNYSYEIDTINYLHRTYPTCCIKFR